MTQIVSAPNAILTRPSKKVTRFDRRLIQMVQDMKKILIATKNPKGVGLAAPQVDCEFAVFLTKPTEKSDIRVFINPQIIASSDDVVEGVPESDKRLEGCLSIPRVWGKVKRAAQVTLRYQDEAGATRQDTFDGFMATIVQHETDHVNGILFTQRVLEQKGKLFQSVKDKDGKEVLEEIKI